METEERRTCQRCGNALSGAIEFCPVCMLREGLAGGVEAGESSASELICKLVADQSHFIQEFISPRGVSHKQLTKRYRR
jgi:hypothetical protein